MNLTPQPPKKTNILTLIEEADITVLPERIRILFGSDIRNCTLLNVSPFFPYAEPSQCVLDFRSVPSQIAEPIQLYARMEVLIGLSVSTIQSSIKHLSRLFVMVQKYHVWDFRLLELSNLRMVLESNNLSVHQCLGTCRALRNFYLVMSSFFGQSNIMMDIKGLENMVRQYSTMVKATQDAHKTPDIDSEYFDTLAVEIPVLAHDKSLSINYRMCAALLWLEMYTGLRPSELLTLRTTSHYYRITESGKRYDYLRYGVPKLSHGGRSEHYAECCMLPGAVAALEMLLDLRQEIPGHDETDTLFLLTNEGNLSRKRFDYYITHLFEKRFNDLCAQKWEHINTRIVGGKKYHIPNLTQYRVHLASYLYRENVGIHLIELGMSHLTMAMHGYYARMQDKTFKDSQARMDNLIRTRTNNDFDLEEHREKGEELLRGFLLALSRFRVFFNKIKEVTEKKYVYEVDRYSKQCRNLLFSVIRPTFNYLDWIIRRDGKKNVLARHPSLQFVVNDMRSLLNLILLWEKALTK